MNHPPVLQSGAELSDDGRERFRLWRTWDEALPVVVWCMLNPRTCDAVALCSVCVSTGKPATSDLPCICGGAGTQAAELAGFREEFFKLQLENTRLTVETQHTATLYRELREAAKELLHLDESPRKEKLRRLTSPRVQIEFYPYPKPDTGTAKQRTWTCEQCKTKHDTWPESQRSTCLRCGGPR